jgi:hypothetical protein
MSMVPRLRTMARRAVGTPDASDVASALGELWDAVAELRASMERIERLAVDNSVANAQRIDDTRHQLDQLQGAVLEQAETLDRMAGQTFSRPPS